MRVQHVCKWHRQFDNSGKDVCFDDRTGWPNTSMTDVNAVQVGELILKTGESQPSIYLPSGSYPSKLYLILSMNVGVQFLP
jgi:hypothetical protein